MKISAQEEYGLRCLIQVARVGVGNSVSIPEICKAEGISRHNAAKLMRMLRRGGFVKSIRGQVGGYELVRHPKDISVGEVLAFLGGRLYYPKFCDMHSGVREFCTHSVDCSVRSLWSHVQSAVDAVLSRVTLEDLVGADEKPLIRRIEISLSAGSDCDSR